MGAEILAMLLKKEMTTGMTTGMKMEMTTGMKTETITVRLSGLVYSVLPIPRTLGPCRRLVVSMLTRQCALFLYLLTLRLLRPWSH